MELKHILLVENDFGNAIIVKRFLKDSFEVVHAVSGEDALAELLNRKYDAILMDIDLGAGMDGVECTRRLRQIEGYHATPVVALTAYAMPVDIHNLHNAGLETIITKPFNKEELTSILSSLA